MIQVLFHETRRTEIITQTFIKSSEKLEASKICGCFYCCEIFNPAEITEWIDENEDGVGQTALCPKCGIDSVIGSNSGFPIQDSFLQEMRKHWF